MISTIDVLPHLRKIPAGEAAAIDCYGMASPVYEGDSCIRMSRNKRKIFALILLVLLIGVPFIDWKLGALLWMSAWLVFIFQNLLGKGQWKVEDEGDGERE